MTSAKCSGLRPSASAGSSARIQPSVGGISPAWWRNPAQCVQEAGSAARRVVPHLQTCRPVSQLVFGDDRPFARQSDEAAIPPPLQPQATSAQLEANARQRITPATAAYPTSAARPARCST